MDTLEMSPRWYVACTTPRHEKAVANRLRTRDVETYLPLYWAVHSWNGRQAKVELPLFPGYVFVRMVITEKAKVLDHPGVNRIVGHNGRAAALPDDDIQKLRLSLAVCKAEPYPYLTVGKRVRIKSGALLGLEGTIIRRKGKVRLIVLIDLIQRGVLLELDAVDTQLAS